MKVNKLLTILLITILILPTISAVVTIVTRTDGLTTPIDYGDLIQFKISGSTAFKPMYITGTVLDENGDIIKEYSETTHNFNSAFRLITVIPSQYGPSGTKTFVGTIRDERGFSKTDTLEFVVNEAAPVLDLNIPDQTLEEDTTITFNLLDYFSDPDRDDLTFSIGSINDMTVSIVNDKNSPVYGQVTIQPDSNWNGQKTNTFMASDGTLSTQSNLVTITVTPVNDQPQGFTVVEDTDEDTPITITLDTLEVDEEDTLTCSIISIWGATETENCVCDDENICTVELTPNQDSTDNVIAFYQLNDGHVDSNFDRIYVTINAINDAPVANDISETTDEDTSKEFHLDCSDVDQNSLTYHIVTDPTSGSIIKSGKKVTYTPNQDYNGDDSFTYKCNDGTVDSNEPTVTINIIPANDPPTTTDDELIVDEDSTSNIIRVLLNDDDIDIVDGDEIHIEDFTQPEDGTVTRYMDNLYYTPDGDFNDEDSFTYTIDDLAGETATATVTVTVNAKNDPPVPDALDEEVDEDDSVDITLSCTDIIDGDTEFSYSIKNNPDKGTLSTISGSSVTYTPDPNWNGLDTFTYECNDGTVDSSNAATVSITINAINDAPVAADVDGTTTDEDVPVDITLSCTDLIDGATEFTYSIANQPAKGTLSLENNLVTYIPNYNENGADLFTYRCNDGIDSENAASVPITINPINDGPTANDDTATTDEDIPVKIEVLANDEDPDIINGDVLTITSVTIPRSIEDYYSHGSTVLSEDSKSITFTPGEDIDDDMYFDYAITDGSGETSTARVIVTVNAINDAPHARDFEEDVIEDTPRTFAITCGDTDSSFTKTILDETTHGTAIKNQDNGFYTYTPNENYFGTDFLTFQCSDDEFNSEVKTGTFTIQSVNDAPILTEIGNQHAEEGDLIEFTLDYDDVDTEDTLTCSAENLPTGSSFDESACTFTWQTGFGDEGTYEDVTFTITDNGDPISSDNEAITITVGDVNRPPVADDLTTTVDEDLSVDIDLSCTDPDGDSVTYTVSNPPQGSLTEVDSDTVSYTPTADYHGSDTFEYKCSDGELDSERVDVDITINSINDDPEIDALTATVDEDLSVDIDLSCTDADTEDTLTYTVFNPSEGSWVAVDSDTVTYTPDADYQGTDTFNYQCNDGTVDTEQATVSITINSVNDAPILDAIGNKRIEEGELLEFALSYSDVDSTGLTCSAENLPTGSSFDESACTFSWQTNFGDEGTYRDVTFTVSDGALSASEAITVRIGDVNRQPIANGLTPSVDEDRSVDIDLSCSDPDGDSVTYTYFRDSLIHGTLTEVDINTLTYTPTSDYHGSDSFEYKCNDEELDSERVDVDITINSVNDAPTLAKIGNQHAEEGESIEFTLDYNDIDSTGITCSAENIPAESSFDESECAFSWQTNFGDEGTYEDVIFAVSDGALSASDSITITVGDVNRAPTADDLTTTTDEDTSVDIDLSCTDPDGDSVTYTVFDPSEGSWGEVDSDTVTYTPNGDHFGTDKFEYKCNDGTTDSPNADVDITINSINDAPVLDEIGNKRVDEGELLEFTLSYTDAEGDDITCSAENLPTGSNFDEPTCTFTWQTVFEDFGTYEDVTFTITDDGNPRESDSEAIIITVGDINQQPTADDLIPSVDEDNSVDIDLSCTDPDGDSVTYTYFSDSILHGTLTEVDTNTVRYTPTGGYHGSDSFTYKCNDGELDSDRASVDITINSVNDAPVLSAIGPKSTSENTLLTFTISATDSDSSTLTYSASNLPSGASFDSSARTFSWRPGFSDSRTYTKVKFTVTDNGNPTKSDSEEITITVNNVNRRPTADDLTTSTSEDSSKEITLSCSDADGNSLSYIRVSGVSHGSLSTINGNKVTYSPSSNYHGSDSFTYKCNDGTVDSNTATVIITVNSRNDAPSARNIQESTNEDISKEITLSCSDADSNSLDYIRVSDVSHGSLSTINGNKVTYSPSSNYHGSDSFTYKCNDGTVDSNTATVSITVNSRNDAPSARNIQKSTNEDTSVNVDLSCSDPDGDSVRFNVRNPSDGSVSEVNANTVRYTPNTDYHGTDSFTYTCSDGSLSDDAKVDITITPVNDAPNVKNIPDQTINEGETFDNIPLNDFIEEYDGSDIIWSYDGNSELTVEINSNNVVTISTPHNNWNGAETITFTATDDNEAALSDSDSATFTVTSVNDVPTAEDIDKETEEDTPIDITLSCSDDDTDDTLTYTVFEPSHGTLTDIEGIDKVRYTPHLNFNSDEEDSFQYKCKDSSDEESNTATVSILVTPVNDAPIWKPLPAADLDEDFKTFTHIKDLSEYTTNPDKDETLTFSITKEDRRKVDCRIDDNKLILRSIKNWHGTTTCTIKADDNEGKESETTLTINVGEVNDGPTLNPIGPKSIKEDQTLTFRVSATDPDGDKLTFTTSKLPKGASFNPATKTFTWRPTFQQSGTYSVTFTVSDGLLSDSETVQIKVGNIFRQSKLSIESVRVPSNPSSFVGSGFMPVELSMSNTGSISVKNTMISVGLFDQEFDLESQPTRVSLRVPKGKSTKKTVYIELPDDIEFGKEYFINIVSRDSYTKDSITVPIFFEQI